VTHDVEEALLLAQRVIILSERPAWKKAEVINDLPYPRHRGDGRLQLLRREIFGHLGMAASL
jgi:NitT/TauT family transport system ATP-binding protein